LVHLEIITHNPEYSTEDVARAIQNWLIGFEMFIFSFAFKYAFSHKDFATRIIRPARSVSGKERLSFFSAFFDTSFPFDIVTETGAVLRTQSPTELQPLSSFSPNRKLEQL